MHQTEFQRFKGVMNGMAKLYERELDAAVLDAYWLALRDWALEDFEEAAGHLMRESKFMPRPAEFNALRKAGRMTAGEAWDRARGCVGVSCGQVHWTPSADAAIDMAVRAIGGPEQIFYCDSDKLTFLERRFTEHYETFQDAEAVRECLPGISGSSTRRLSGPQKVGALMRKP